MGIIGTGFSMSLDGFIAEPGGDTTLTTPDDTMQFKVSETSVELLQTLHQSTGASVSGRGLFDLTNGRNGRHPMDVPVVVLTHHVPQAWIDEHPDARFTFVTEGIEQAVKEAQALAGSKNVGIGPPMVVGV